MNTQAQIKLSSGWTNVALYGSAGLLLFVGFVSILASQGQPVHGGTIFAMILFLVLMGIVSYLFIYACDARIMGEKLVLKKQFRPAKSYAFDKIGFPSAFQYRTTKYITFYMENEDGSEEKYMIINSNSLIAFENKDAEEVLIRLREIAGVTS
jgi:hypothetical protein